MHSTGIKIKIFDRYSVDDLRKQVIDALFSLIILTEEEVQKRLDGINSLPKEALLKMLPVIAEAVNKQQEYFKILNDRDRKFSVKLDALTLEVQLKKKK